MLTNYDMVELTQPHALLCQNNPIVNIFKNLNWDEYSYGDIKNRYLSTRDVQMYYLHQQENANLQSQAQALA